MNQTRQDMESILHELQTIQTWAFKNSIHTFEIGARTYPLEDEGEGREGLIREYGDTEERVLSVCIFLKGDDSEGDHLSVSVYQGHNTVQIFRALNNIKSFIGYV